MGHGVPMARVRGAERLDALRARWHHASLKTSFMVYMLGFLLLALVMSTVTAGMFSGLQHRVIADAYEISGLYLYDAHNRTLVPARAVDIDENGSSVFVQTVRGEMTEMPLTDLSSLVEITDASDYQYSPGTAYLYGSANDDALSVETPEAPDQTELTPAELPAYDAKARDRFDAWLAANPDSPYTSFFDGDSQDGNTVGLLTSAVGYYVNTPPSEEAQALSSALELLTFLMFPLWFGLCIFAAARRFFGKRLQPGFDVLDRAASNIASFMLSPTVLDTHTLYPIDTYGSGMAPLFTSLALWVGVFMLMVLFKLEVDNEGLEGRHVTTNQTYMARYLLLAIVAGLQGIVCAVGDLIIRVQCANRFVFILTAWLTSLAYLAIAYALSATFMHVGKALVVALVMLQIPGASGLYPIEMMPDFYRALYPFFPFTYSINAFRETIAGFYDGDWLTKMLMLALFTAIAFFVGLVVRPWLVNLKLDVDWS